MAYSTLQDLIKRYGESDIVKLTDRTNRPPTTIDQSLVDEAIASADAEINMYLPTRYKLPLDKVPLPLIKASCILAYANLNPKQAKDAPEMIQADKQRAILEKLSEGKITLGLTIDNTEAELADTVQISEGRKDWERNY